MNGVIERTSDDMDSETIELFNEIKPLIEDGYSICRAVKTVKGVTSVNTKLTWYQKVKQYCIDNGYPADVNLKYGRPRKVKH